MSELETIANLERYRDEVITFLDSRIYREYIQGTKEAIKQTEKLLTEIRITCDADIYFQIELRAKLDVAEANLTNFEDMISTLDNRIEAILKTVQPSEIKPRQDEI